MSSLGGTGLNSSKIRDSGTFLKSGPQQNWVIDRPVSQSPSVFLKLHSNGGGRPFFLKLVIEISLVRRGLSTHLQRTVPETLHRDGWTQETRPNTRGKLQWLTKRERSIHTRSCSSFWLVPRSHSVLRKGNNCNRFRGQGPYWHEDLSRSNLDPDPGPTRGRKDETDVLPRTIGVGRRFLHDFPKEWGVTSNMEMEVRKDF